MKRPYLIAPFLLLASCFPEEKPPEISAVTAPEAEPETTEENEDDSPKGDSVEGLIDWLLDHEDTLDELPFSGIIGAAADVQILPVDPEAETDAAIVAALSAAMDGTLDRLNQPDSPAYEQGRINEVSKYFEEEMLTLLNATPGFACDFPPTAEGNPQRSGYPDLRLVHLKSGRVTYVDPKLFKNDSMRSSLRTFYFEPKTHTNKVLEDAHHILVGIAHDGKTGEWTFESYHLVDLSGFKVRLKAEFQASNKDLYREELIIGGSPE